MWVITWIVSISTRLSKMLQQKPLLTIRRLFLWQLTIHKLYNAYISSEIAENRHMYRSNTSLANFSFSTTNILHHNLWNRRLYETKNGITVITGNFIKVYTRSDNLKLHRKHNIHWTAEECNTFLTTISINWTPITYTPPFSKPKHK